MLQRSTVAWRAIIYPCKDLPLTIAVCRLTLSHVEIMLDFPVRL